MKLSSKNLATLATFLVMLNCWPESSQAVVVGWSDGMTIWLGDGVNLNRQDTPTFPGVVELSPSSQNAKNGWQNEIVTFAQHTHDMVKTLRINASAKVASITGSGGSGSMDFFFKQAFSENDLKFVFTKKRHFGTTLRTPVGFSPLFTNQVATYQRTLQGEALHARIVNTFGSHYVRGHDESAFVTVVYTFHYKSSGLRKSLNVSASGSAVGYGSFSGFANSFFTSADAALSLTYQLYSSSSQPLPAYLNTGGVITNYQNFTNFVTHLETYVNSMAYADAKVTGYVLDPIESVPGYLSLLGGTVPLPVDSGDADDFFQIYSALQTMDQRVGAAAGSMTWFNTLGQQVVQAKAQDVRNALSAMSTIASNHFATGAPLRVPSDAVTHLACVKDIATPELYVMDSFIRPIANAADERYVLGRVDCGERNLVKAIPFINLARLRYGTNYGNTVPVYYDPKQFETLTLGTYTSSVRYDHLTNLFASAQWACLTNPLTNPRLNGFFLVYNTINSTTPERAMGVAVKDDTGNSVAVLPQLDTRAGGCGVPAQFTGDAAVSVATSFIGSGGTVGLARSVPVQVTNASAFQTHGTTVAFALGSDFDFAGASGSQGFASFNPSNRVVTYAIGPLLAGTSADLDFHLIPLRTNAVPGSVVSVGLGVGLSNLAAETNAAIPGVLSAAPVLEMERGPGGLLLNWSSDTDRLGVESSAQLGAGGTWTYLTNGVVQFGNQWFLPAQLSGQQGFFRIRTR